jgi:very-short-patch-repair endonuclease
MSIAHHVVSAAQNHQQTLPTPIYETMRMDFLMLLPGNRRVVLEVDGMQHFTRNGGTEPDSAKYAATMAGDRDLKFGGYEVFRFGHDELRDRDRAQPLLASFFDTLLGRPSASPS